MASGKVDAIDINSGAMARVGMDALITAGALEARGVETGPPSHHPRLQHHRPAGHAARCMDRRRRAQRSGHYRRSPSVGDYPETSAVYEVDSVGLVKVLHRLNQGTDWAGRRSEEQQILRSASRSTRLPTTSTVRLNASTPRSTLARISP